MSSSPPPRSRLERPSVQLSSTCSCPSRLGLRNAPRSTAQLSPARLHLHRRSPPHSPRSRTHDIMRRPGPLSLPASRQRRLVASGARPKTPAKGCTRIEFCAPAVLAHHTGSPVQSALGPRHTGRTHRCAIGRSVPGPGIVKPVSSVYLGSRRPEQIFR